MKKHSIIKKKVHFSPGESLVTMHSAAEEEVTRYKDKDGCYYNSTKWFNHKDFVSFKESAQSVSSMAIKHGLTSILNNVYGTKDSKSLKHQERLNAWAKHGHSRRGLERWCNAKHATRRSNNEVNTISRVIECQNELFCTDTEKRKQQSLDTHTSISQSEDEKAAILCNISELHSSEARRFAIMMGKADELAVHLSSQSSSQCDRLDRLMSVRKMSIGSIEEGQDNIIDPSSSSLPLRVSSIQHNGNYNGNEQVKPTSLTIEWCKRKVEASQPLVEKMMKDANYDRHLMEKGRSCSALIVDLAKPTTKPMKNEPLSVLLEANNIDKSKVFSRMMQNHLNTSIYDNDIQENTTKSKGTICSFFADNITKNNHYIESHHNFIHPPKHHIIKIQRNASQRRRSLP